MSTAHLGVRAARRIALAAAICAALGPTSRVRALVGDQPPRVLVISASAEAGADEAELAEFIEAVREALASLEEFELSPPPALDLEAAQLAIDCTDESARCAAEVAERMDADIAIVPLLKRRADALELHLKSARRSAPDRWVTAMRRQAGTRLDATLLATAPSMVREVLELPNESSTPEAEHEPDSAPDPLPARDPRAFDAEEMHDSAPLGPILLGGGGAALLVAGVVMGAVASATEDDYASRSIDTPEQAERADAVRESGEQEALIANVLLGTGAAAVIAAGVWYLIDGGLEREPSGVALRPVLGPSSAGLVLKGAWQP